MDPKDLYSHFFNHKRDHYGRTLAITLAVGFHVAALAGLWAFSQPSKPKNKLMLATPVTLSANPNRASGKKSKAPVAGRQKTNQPKPKPQEKKPVAKKTPVKKPDEVGTRTDQKKKAKPKPAPEDPTPKDVKPTEQPKETPAEPAPPQEEDRTIPIAKGGFGGVTDSGISFEMGSPNAKVDVKDFEFLSYFRQVHEAIARRWSRGGLTGGITTIRFEIHRDGSIKNPTIIQSAGKAYLDNPAKLAVIGADLPPLPQGVREDVLEIDINFHYQDQK